MVINALLAVTEANTYTHPMVSVIVKLMAHEMMFHIAQEKKHIDIKLYTK